MKLLLRLMESYILILFLSLGFGLFFPTYGQIFTPYSTIFLQIIFFLSALKINFGELRRSVQNLRVIALVNFYMLIACPLITYGIAKLLIPEYATPLMLLAAMPVGLSVPLLVEIIGGSVSLAMVITTTSAFLAPITIPLIVNTLVGAEVSIDAFAMFKNLAWVILVPFVLGQLLRLLFRKRIHLTFFTLKPLSIILLGLIIIGTIAKHAPSIRAGSVDFITPLIILTVFFACLHIVGYWCVPKVTRAERLTVMVSITHMSFVLAIYIAGKFFPDPRVLLPTILSVFPWSISIGIMEKILKRK